MEHVFVLNYFAEQPLKYDEAVIITPEVLQNIEIKFSLILKYKENEEVSSRCSLGISICRLHK